ncbi:NADH-ubiquinone reductase complex 1 MLRQ subunit, partial [Tanacetum coccineum]
LPMLQNMQEWIGHHLPKDMNIDGMGDPSEKLNFTRKVSHAKLRNVIERAFGVLKACFPILKKMPSYPFVTQRDIVVACFVIHNFIRKERLSDEFFSLYNHREVDDDNSNLQDDNVVVEDVQPYGNAADQEYITSLRDSIAAHYPLMF